jgi:DNA replication and repair protein RecF
MMPILLLDDCLESLDHTRASRLMERLSSHQGQVLMTAPGDVPEDIRKNLQHLSLNEVAE